MDKIHECTWDSGLTYPPKPVAQIPPSHVQPDAHHTQHKFLERTQNSLCRLEKLPDKIKHAEQQCPAGKSRVEENFLSFPWNDSISKEYCCRFSFKAAFSRSSLSAFMVTSLSSSKFASVWQALLVASSKIGSSASLVSLDSSSKAMALSLRFRFSLRSCVLLCLSSLDALTFW